MEAKHEYPGSPHTRVRDRKAEEVLPESKCDTRSGNQQDKGVKREPLHEPGHHRNPYLGRDSVLQKSQTSRGGESTKEEGVSVRQRRSSRRISSHQGSTHV